MALPTSIRQPKPKQIRLPFAVARPRKGAEPEARVCGICRTADSNYTCPRCNVAYCSLTCFRAPTHTQCSEPFYKATVHESIASDPSAASATERREMLAMLKRFEESAADGADALAAMEEEEEEEDLAAALEGVDLDSIDANALLRLLPQNHRDAFLSTLSNPSSVEAKQLVQSAVAAGHGFSAPTQLPWWEADAVDADGQAVHAPVPEDIMPQIAGIKPPEGVGLKSVFNVIAILVAYVHVLLSYRLPSLDPTPEMRAELLALLPFLAPGSTTRYTSVSAAWGGVWDAINAASLESESEPLAPAALIRVLEIVTALLHPPITTAPPPAALVLADVHRALNAKGAAAKKVAFYRAAIAQIGRREWLALERELGTEIERLRDELGDSEGDGEGESEEPVRESLVVGSASTPRVSQVQGGAKIELL